MVNASSVFALDSVSVRYGWTGKPALEEVTLGLSQGRSLALLGLNGAGKTTTIRLLLGMIRPKTGTVKVLDSAPGSVRALSQIGYAPEEATPPELLGAEEYLRFVAGLRIPDKSKREAAVKDAMEWFELPSGKRVRAFSKGMRRKVILAQAMLGDPRLLILDEPLNGLDPLFIIKLRERLESFVKGGGSLLLSSHILAEVEKLCNDIAIIKEGRLVASASSEEIVHKHGTVEGAFSALVGKREEVAPWAT